MTNQTRSAVRDAATKTETLAYNLANASILASMLSGVLDNEIDGRFEGQAFLAPSNLLDKLAKDCEGLSGDLYALHRGMHGGVSNKAPSTGASAYEGGRGSWPRSKQR